MYKTCPNRCTRELVQFYLGTFPACPLRSFQVESVMQNKGVVQNVILSDVMRLLFNLRFQVFFVCQDVPAPLGDGLILTHPDLLSNLKGKQNNCHDVWLSKIQFYHFIKYVLAELA